MKKNILVLCTGNSCRSQIAEGYLRFFAKDKANIYSAGIETHGVNPKAIQIMQEDGLDISQHTSNHINEYADIVFDMLITVCDHAQEQCPFIPGNTLKIHQSFNDPAKATGSDHEIMEKFREVRDAIKTYCKQFAESYL